MGDPLLRCWLRSLVVVSCVVGLHAMPRLVAAQAVPLTIGEGFTVRSAVLGESRRINVYLPPAYGDSASRSLPVLYMLDGGMAEDFLHIAGLLQVSVGNGTMRPFMLVGIENTERRRDLTGPTTVESDRRIAPRVGGSAAFRQFIAGELMPEVQRRYRTTGEAALIGESLAGLFVVETFLLEPRLFDTYIAVDPSLWWNDGRLVAEAGGRLRVSGAAAPTLYLSTSSQPDIAALTRQLADTLNLAAPAGVRWRLDAMPWETHATILHPAALRAVRWLFALPPK